MIFRVIIGRKPKQKLIFQIKQNQQKHCVKQSNKGTVTKCMKMVLSLSLIKTC